MERYAFWMFIKSNSYRAKQIVTDRVTLYQGAPGGMYQGAPGGMYQGAPGGMYH